MKRAPSPQVAGSTGSVLASIKRDISLQVPKQALARSLSLDDIQSYIDALYENIRISSYSTGLASQFAPFDDVTLPLACRLLRTLSSERGVLPSSIHIQDIQLVRSDPDFAGGFGRVQLGLYEGRHVAIKTLHPGDANNWKRSCREAVIWLLISHPYTLSLEGVYLSDDGTCLKMVSPWCNNGNIERYLTSDNRKQERGRLLTEIADAIEYLHSRGIVHDDLHPQNILIGDDGHARVADFGLSDFIDSSVPNSLFGGVMDYVAPERHFSPLLRQKEGDIFSFASLCFFVYTLRAPFSGERQLGRIAVAIEIAKGTRPPRPTDVQCGGPGADMPDGLWEVVVKCWLHNPAARPSAMEVLDRLRVMFHQ